MSTRSGYPGNFAEHCLDELGSVQQRVFSNVVLVEHFHFSFSFFNKIFQD